MKVAYSVVFLVLAFTLSIFSSDSYASVPPEGFPRFFNSVKVDVAPSGGDGFTITAENDGFGDFFFTRVDGGPQDKVYNGQFLLTASFNNALEFQSGSVSINGTFWSENLSGFPPPPDLRTNLFSADLVEADASKFLTSSPTPTLGFRTLFSSFDGWAAQFGNADESVYLTLNNPLPGNILSLYAGMFDGSSTITTVPVPPAVWLLVSAFASLAVIGRRRSIDSAV